MTAGPIANLERLLAAGKDGALLRFGLGNAHLQAGDAAAAATHLRRAVEIDPLYSAAWKLLGKALLAAGQPEAAAAAWDSGVAAAQQKGDKQAEREMLVFLKRLRAAPPNPK